MEVNMCYSTQIGKNQAQLSVRFKASFVNPDWFEPGNYTAFTFPLTPVITHVHPDTIHGFSWGLLPPWAKDLSIRKNTLNARIETLDQKPSFKLVLSQRCLVLADGFYEWKWLDAKGKAKQKYLLTVPDGEAFAFAGLWNAWMDKSTGEIVSSYTIITTAANELMSEIHNTKKRMPVILSPHAEKDWLKGGALVMQNDSLQAAVIS
jgi:putative SOS response-associated peptidase YedK